MKTYINKLFIALSAIMLIVACESDWINPESTFDKGGLVKAVQEADKASLDGFGDLSAQSVEFTLVPTDANGKGSGDLIESAEVFLEFVTFADGSTTTETSIDLITDFSSKIVYTVPDLVALAGIDVNNLAGGDSFNFSFDVTMKDGRKFTHDEIENTICGAVNSRGTCTLVVSIVCPSDNDAIAGEYSSVITASNFGGFVGATNSSVLITPGGPEQFRYNISDISSLAYVAFGGSAYGTTFIDICETPIFANHNTFGTTSDTGGGTWDPVNGILTFNAFEANNGLTWTVVLTKK